MSPDTAASANEDTSNCIPIAAIAVASSKNPSKSPTILSPNPSIDCKLYPAFFASIAALFKESANLPPLRAIKLEFSAINCIASFPVNPSFINAAVVEFSRLVPFSIPPNIPDNGRNAATYCCGMTFNLRAAPAISVAASVRITPPNC